jgi:hypothetical protein
LFDRVHELIKAAYPQAAVVHSYHMPAQRVGGRREKVGVWRHGLSLCRGPQGQDGGFVARHPRLQATKGTIRIRAQDAPEMPRCDLAELIRAALDGEHAQRPTRRPHGVTGPARRLRRGRHPASRASQDSNKNYAV